MGPIAGLDLAEKRKVIAPDGNRAPTGQRSTSTPQLLIQLNKFNQMLEVCDNLMHSDDSGPLYCRPTFNIIMYE
jgi:hypothetical protein